MKKNDKVRIVLTWNTASTFGELKAEKEYTLGSTHVEAVQFPRTTIAYTPSSDRISRVKADLRVLATGLEAYFVDCNKYPSAAGNLTTPIAYLMNIPADPFSSNGKQYGYRPLERAASWMAYSVGPDTIDSAGAVPFDPTNGTSSAGDIVRIKDDKSWVAIMSAPKVQEQAFTPADLSSEMGVRSGVARAKYDLRSMATAIESYYVDHNVYPSVTYVLTTPVAYMTRVPRDPFTKNGADYILLRPQPAGWMLYSLGPDQQDHKGAVPFDPTNGTWSGGDIIRTGP